MLCYLQHFLKKNTIISHLMFSSCFFLCWKYWKVPLHLLIKLAQCSQELAQCSRFRTTFTSKIPFHKFPRLWNELLTVCHQITSTHIFKTKIQTSLLDSYSNQITCNYDRCKQCYPNIHVWNINREHIRYDMCLLWIHYSCVLPPDHHQASSFFQHLATLEDSHYG